MTSFERADEVLRFLERGAAYGSAAMLFAIMLIVVVDVILRYALKAPLGWGYDIVSLYLMAGLFFFSLADTLRENGHVSVNILHGYMSVAARHAAELVSCAVALAVFVPMLAVSAGRAWNGFRAGEVLAGQISWPVWVAQAFVPLGVALLVLRLLFRIWGHARSLLLRRSEIALPPLAGGEDPV